MKRLSLLFLFFLLIVSGHSQNWETQRFEISGGVSIFQYFGDIGGSADANNLFGIKDISLKANRPGVNFGMSYWVRDGFLVQASNLFGLFAQSDKGSRNSDRNYSFSTVADELSFQGSYFFIKENKNINYSNIDMRGGKKNFRRIISIYAFTGAGLLYFKVTPKESLIGSPRFNGSKSITVVLPIGIGARLALTGKLSLAAELGARLTFTDYLDGFTSQYSKHNDFYYIMNLKAVYHLTMKRRSKINAGY